MKKKSQQSLRAARAARPATIIPPDPREPSGNLHPSLAYLHLALYPFRPVCGADEANQATTERAEHSNCLACLRERVRMLSNERDELAVLLRRTIGVVSDVERTRPEAAAVLDRYAELWPIGGRL